MPPVLYAAFTVPKCPVTRRRKRRFQKPPVTHRRRDFSKSRDTFPDGLENLHTPNTTPHASAVRGSMANWTGVVTVSSMLMILAVAAASDDASGIETFDLPDEPWVVQPAAGSGWPLGDCFWIDEEFPFVHVNPENCA